MWFSSSLIALFVAVCLVPHQVRASETWNQLLARADSLSDAKNQDSAILIGKLSLGKTRAEFGGSDTASASVMQRLASYYLFKASYDQADSLVHQALTIREKVLGPYSPDLATSVKLLGIIRLRQRHNLEAESLYERALAIQERTWGPDHLEVASTLNNLGAVYRYEARYTEAESLHMRALAIKERALGPDHSDLTIILDNLGRIYQLQARYAEAESVFKRACAITEKAFGPDHMNVAYQLIDLGTVYRCQGHYAEAESAFRRALAITEEVLGPDEVNVASRLVELGTVYRWQGHYAEAESAYKRALAIAERNFGPDHPEVATALLGIGNVYNSQGRYADAEPLYKRALAIQERDPGLDPLTVAATLNNLGGIYYSLRRHVDAEQLLERAIAVREKVLGPNHPDVASTLSNLGSVYCSQGRYADAESTFKRAQAIQERALNSDHPNVAGPLSGLGNVYYCQARYTEAEPFLKRALAIEERALGLDHPDVASCYNSLAKNYRAARRPGMGIPEAGKALNILLGSFRDNVGVLSERDALAYSQGIRRVSGSCLSCYVDIDTERPDHVAEACNIILETKGIVSEGVIQRQRAVATEADSVTIALVGMLRDARLQVANLYGAGPGEDTTGLYRRKLDSLTRQANELEGDLSRHSASYGQKKDLQNITWERVASLLPVNSALIEFLSYDYQQVWPDSLIPHYLAMVVRGSQKPVIVDLGQTVPVDQLINDYRQQMQDIASSGRMPSAIDLDDYKKLSEKLYSRIWKPIERSVPANDLVFIAGDGALNLVSFAGLPTPDGKYLIEDHPIQYLSSGRDLIRLKDKSTPCHGLLAIGDPDFDALPSARVSEIMVAQHGDTASASYAMRNVRSGCGSLTDIKAEALPGTRTEVEQVATQWKRATIEPEIILYGPQASEDNVKKYGPGSRVMHLATHGYFLEGVCQPSFFVPTLGSDDSFVGENPLLLSGLLFAGANLHGVGADSANVDDGILSAYEVSGMDLTGSDLVVLSACETGLGEVKQGEGVYGLRRAFQLAGARTVISALWPVGDQATSEMMGTLYGDASRPLYERIRQMQLDQVKRLRSAGVPDHPFSWAAFIATGDWR
jgi:tetratricopeptide (TPR) repeat protein/CHAT domain-containing protein